MVSAVGLIPPGLSYADAGPVTAKITALRAGGLGKLLAVFDFDHTLTLGQPAGSGVTTFELLVERLAPAQKARYRGLFTHYDALRASGAMTTGQAADWWSSVLDLFVECRLDIAQLRAEFVRRAPIRPGVRSLFAFCERHGVHTTVLSAGILNLIGPWLAAHGIEPTTVLATPLEVDAAGRLRGWDRRLLIHGWNKREQWYRHGGLAEIRARRPGVLLVGDSPGDSDMADGDDVLRVRVHDAPAPASAAVRAQTFPLFDALIETGDLRPVRRLVAAMA